ncbi:MAG: type II secretion system minor pseudopilin GspK [Sphingopyxis sp.]
MTPNRKIWHRLRQAEHGAALLTVLLIVAVMAIVSANAIERLTLATRLAQSSSAINQTRHFQLAAEALALRRIDTLTATSRSQVTLEGGWLDRPYALPLPNGGSAELRITDSGNCFNLNSLVSDAAAGIPAQRPIAIEQFMALMLALGLPREQASRISGVAVDWIDADQTTSSDGAEDSVYANSAMPFLTGDRPLTDASEIRAMAGVTTAHWSRLSPWLCALPTSDLSPINANTLLPEQAPLLQMLLPGKIDPAHARAHIAARPANGYGRMERFWQEAARDGTPPVGDVASQVKLTTRWFRLRTRIRVGDATLTASSLIDAGENNQAARVVRRAWSPEL